MAGRGGANLPCFPIGANLPLFAILGANLPITTVPPFWQGKFLRSLLRRNSIVDVGIWFPGRTPDLRYLHDTSPKMAETATRRCPPPQLLSTFPHPKITPEKSSTSCGGIEVGRGGGGGKGTGGGGHGGGRGCSNDSGSKNGSCCGSFGG